MDTTGSKRIDELVALAVQGDGRAFTYLWDTYIIRLRTFIKGWLKTLGDQDVDDICSRSFEKAFRQIELFDSSKGKFFTWLSSIARNTALDLLESEGRVHPKSRTVYLDSMSEEVGIAEMIPDQVDSPLESIIRMETRETTAKYIEALPSLYREVARKRMIDGMQYKEIAEAMDLELNTVRTRIRRARSIIEKMKEEDDEN